MIFCFHFLTAGIPPRASASFATQLLRKGLVLFLIELSLTSAFAEGTLKIVKAVASAYVSDSRWQPLPTSPGRFNVRKSPNDMIVANNALRDALMKHGIAHKRSLYSPELIDTQIKAIDEKLMVERFFGE